LRRMPTRPMLLPFDHAFARPFEACATKADAIAHRRTEALDNVEEVVADIDDHGARCFTGRIGHDLTMESLVETINRNGRDGMAAIDYSRVGADWRAGDLRRSCLGQGNRSGSVRSLRR